MKHSTRLLSVFLATALAMSLCVMPAFGTEIDSEQQAPAVEPGTNSPSGIESNESESAPGPIDVQVLAAEGEADSALPANQGDTGSVRVQVFNSLDIDQAIEFMVDVVVSAGGEVVYAEAEPLGLGAFSDGLSASSGSVSFDNLPAGTCEVKVSGSGFVTYQQSFEINNDTNALTLHAGEVAFTQDAAHPGILFYGDATGDGVVDDADTTAIVDAIDLRTAAGNDDLPATDDASCDLNKDNRVTLVDLQYAADVLGKERVTSTVERSVSSAAVEATVPNDATVESGKLEDVVGNVGAPVTIKAPQAISEGAPLSIAFDLAKDAVEPPVLGGMTVASPPASQNAITSGYVSVEYVDTDGSTQTIDVPIGNAPQQRSRSVDTSKATATISSDGTIVVDFGGQIAVKKVTLTITATSDSGNLAEISKVEFLNDMANKIPPPDMSVPGNVAAKPGSKQFTVSWDKAQNVTGYELSISGPGKDGKAIEEVLRTTATSLTVTSFDRDKLVNNTTYTVKVQSINGTWRSGWSPEVNVVPKADRVPAPPDGLTAKGLYRGFSASWKDMLDTDSYNLFYREKGTEAYTKIAGISGTSQRVDGLKDDTEYQLYLTGVNELGEGAPSLTAVVRTVNVKPAQLPAYRLINTKSDDGTYLNHIAAASHGRGSMFDSPLDEGGAAKSALGLFDDSYTSYLKVEDWDEGGSYPGPGKGITVSFDEPQTLGMISFAEVEDATSYGDANVQYLDEKGAWKSVGTSLQMRTCENGRKYALVKLASPVVAKQIKIGVGRSNSYQRNVVIAEMRFHAYDSLEADIMGLYADDLHVVLKDEVTSGMLDDLQKRLDTPDEVSGEFHPYRSALQKELDTARSLLATTGLDDTVRPHMGISAEYDNRNLGITGLNAWQPLGAVAGAGDQIVIYAGSPGVATGTSASLRLVVAQQHPESSGVAQVVANLKAGRNEITIPSLSSTDVERGGQLYLEYTGSNKNANWGVRVSGASPVPTLDLYQVTDAAERLQRTKDYVQELEAQVPLLQAQHDQLHRDGDNRNLKYDYSAENCILNATDIMLDQMMYSVPTEQVLSGSGSGSTDERAVRLLASLDAMDQMMDLFYEHKGLTNSFDVGTPKEVATLNALPSRHLNIRYTRMFAGAFMYASGNHIGIEWGSVPALCQSAPIVLDENGARVSGNLFGWGIAHEVGHNINQAQYSVAEITNNYYAQLARTDETSATARFSYDDVYQRVTSGDQGKSDEGFRLAMYWQLRLAFDEATAFQPLGTYQKAMGGRLFARIDSYARNVATAPAPKGTALTLGGDKDQNLMRLASAASERNLTEFFARWGVTPDATTVAYVDQFAVEPRAIYYANDDARAYARSHTDVGLVAGKDVVTASANAHDSEVTLALGVSDNAAADAVLGYEVARLTISGGKQQREVVGFSTGDTYVDNASAMNNRVVAYEVTAIDKFLNRSTPLVLDALKITGDGMQVKDGWTATTNMTSDQDVVPPASDDDPDAPAVQRAVNWVVDGATDSVFTGVSSEEDPSVVVDMTKRTEVTAVRIKFTDASSAIGTYRIAVSDDGAASTTLGEGTLELDADNTAMVYFNNGEDPWICTYDARYLNITATGQAGKTLSIAEIDVFGPAGDNVDFAQAEGETAIGILDEDFVYQQGIDGMEAQFIPKDSIVFTGTYKGNPAYNVVVLYDDNGKIVGGKDASGNVVSNQIIMAPAPGDALLGNTSEGRWVYWIDPAKDGPQPVLPAAVRAELYRVDNALTNAGQRLVSDTLFTAVPSKLPSIHLQSGAVSDQAIR